VTVEVVDEAGAVVPNASLPIQFKVEGDGELAAVENGNPGDMKSFRTPQLTSFKGRGLAIIRPTGTSGEIKLTAESAGLASAAVILSAR
jgi:beta-galactosidase